MSHFKQLFLPLVFFVIKIDCANYEQIQTIDNIDINNNGLKAALIFGITGQDGTYLTNFLLKKNYTVYGIVRRMASQNIQKLNLIFKKESPDIKRNLILIYGDITDYASVSKIICTIQPDEIYNLAAQSHVKISFENPTYTAQVDAIGTLNILESIRNSNLTNKTKFYQASTSELYGKVQEIPQNEKTSFYPRSPYGCAKQYAHWITINYREAYNLFSCNGILFNHESPYRGDNFVTKIISTGVAKIKLGLQEYITIGNLNAKRDWGFAGDYVEAMWLMLQQKTPTDYVIAT